MMSTKEQIINTLRGNPEVIDIQETGNTILVYINKPIGETSLRGVISEAEAGHTFKLIPPMHG
jgi:hypothetical protein